ncbi:MAG TPA: TonB-dependent receptor plug domain-containing protein [Lacunisphaera sp.]|nr:TonB-dependent receptor plug domain-containing protein [Lacunisphaera sp.]
MKRPTVRSRALVGTAALCLVSVLRLPAQTTAPAAGQKPVEELEDTLVLSPFVVEASEDTDGYSAKSTLAGSRVRTDLRDVASPISVVTSQFLKDTASNNNQDLLTYTTSTEVGGLFGNWGGFGNSQGASDRGSLLSPNQNTRVRGLDSADNTRNFMLTDIPWDSYNTDRVEIQRGPNSILFGVGSPAGIINANTISARFDGNRGKVEVQASSHSSLRSVVDYNAELVDDLLAVRIAVLDTRQKYRQKPAFNDETRGFVTASFQPQVLPKSWASKLTVRANFEKANIEANRPRMLPPEDGISLWFDDVAGDGVNNKIGFGKRVYDMFLWSQTGGGDPYRGTIATASTTVLNPLPYQPGMATVDGGALNNGGIGFWYKNGSSTPYFVSRQAPRAFPGALDANGVPGNNPIDIPYGSPLRVGSMYAYATSMDKIAEIEGKTSPFPLASRGYYKDQSLSDASVFNYYNQLIDGDNKREHQRWDSGTISLSQTFWNNRLGLELLYDKQNYAEWRDGATWNRPYISIDVNKNLQNQLTQYTRTAGNLIDTSSYTAKGFTPSASQPYANPMAGAAYTGGEFAGNNRTDRDRKNLRLTTFAEFRAEDVFKRDSMLAQIIGRHAFTGLVSREERLDAVTQWVPSAVPYAFAYSLSISGEDTQLTGATRGITPIIYLSDPLFGRSSASGLNLGPINTYYNPSGTYSVDYFKTQWIHSPGSVNPADPWTNLLGDPTDIQARNPSNYVGRTRTNVTILNANTGDQDQLTTSYGQTEQIVDSVGVVWQGHLFGDNLVPTVGVRKDKLRTSTATAKKDATGISQTTVGDLTQVLENVGRTTSWGAVAHMPKSWIKNVPVLSGLSAYYNRGENNRVEARYNYDGQPLDNPSASSTDYGVVVSAFDDKLTLKVGHFETKVKNANLPGGASILGSNQYYLYQLEAWGTANTLMYAFGRSGLDPNQSWHWNWALVDDNAWGNENGTYAPSTALFQNHASSVKQLAAMDAWMNGIDSQFFTNYAIPAKVADLKTAYASWRSSGNIAPLVAAAQASGFAVGTYTTGFSSGNNGQINGISPNGTIDNTSEGYEFELNYQPVPQWNIQLNASKTNAFRESLGQPMLDFINKQWTKLQGPAGDIRLWWGGDNTLRRYYQDNIISAVEFQKESIGFQVPELRPWSYSVISNYNFKEGRLKSFNLGGAWRWQDKQILGYGLKDNKSGLDVTKPLFGETEKHLDLWVGYDRKINDKIKWRVQLNLRNVGEAEGLTPISANPDGTIAVQRITEGMGWSLTNTFSF